MKIIGIEEHWAPQSLFDHLGTPGYNSMKTVMDIVGLPLINPMTEKLCDIGNGRVGQMDADGMDMQILSLTAPGVEQLDADDAFQIAHETNDIIAEAVERNHERFRAFAAIPTSSPEKAAEEIEYRMKMDAFVGLIINGHNKGRFLDDPMYTPILETAEKLEAPIYIHPTEPVQSVADTYYDVKDSNMKWLLSCGGFGWHIETAIHVLRLVGSGAFDRYPKLQVVIGHLGEGIPFFINRLNSIRMNKLQRSIPEYLRQNVNYTISGFNYKSNFNMVKEEIGIDRIMFSTDYPFNPMKPAMHFLDSLAISNEEKEKVAYRNAEKLFKI